jgi:hypothetical protein
VPQEPEAPKPPPRPTGKRGVTSVTARASAGEVILCLILLAACLALFYVWVLSPFGVAH